jgi:hypothetical protein
MAPPLAEAHVSGPIRRRIVAGNEISEAILQFRLQPYVMTLLQWIGSHSLLDGMMYDQSSQRAPRNQLAHRESQPDSKTASTLRVSLPSKNISQTFVWKKLSHIGQSYDDFPIFIARTRQGAITYFLGSPANDTSLLHGHSDVPGVAFRGQLGTVTCWPIELPTTLGHVDAPVGRKSCYSPATTP